MIKWTLLNIGQFSRNRYWGESDEKSYRGAICTTTVLSHDGKHMIIDPGFDAKQMPGIINARTGLSAEDISTVYITHSHADHFMGLEIFVNADIYSAPDCYEEINSQLAEKSEMAKKVLPAPESPFPGVKLLPLPGHTPGLCGLLFDAAEGRVVVAGDSVMTRDFFRDARGYFNSLDFEQSTQTIKKLYDIADVIVPGHDNYFLVKAALK